MVTPAAAAPRRTADGWCVELAGVDGWTAADIAGTADTQTSRSHAQLCVTRINRELRVAEAAQHPAALVAHLRDAQQSLAALGEHTAEQTQSATLDDRTRHRWMRWRDVVAATACSVGAQIDWTVAAATPRTRAAMLAPGLHAELAEAAATSAAGVDAQLWRQISEAVLGEHFSWALWETGRAPLTACAGHNTTTAGTVADGARVDRYAVMLEEHARRRETAGHQVFAVVRWPAHQRWRTWPHPGPMIGPTVAVVAAHDTATIRAWFDGWRTVIVDTPAAGADLDRAAEILEGLAGGQIGDRTPLEAEWVGAAAALATR